MASESEPKRRVCVVAMDGSKESEGALDFYMKDIYKENDEVIVTYCVHHRAQQTYGSVWMPVDPNIISHAYHEESKKGEEVCNKLRARLHTYEKPIRVLKLEGGDPGHTICQKLDELEASLIVIGCRGLGTIRRTLMGSVSEYVMHHSHVPVFVCRQ